MILVLILMSVPGLAQKSGLTQSEKQIAYEGALLDSVYRYEKLKPTYYSLKSAYESQGKAAEEYRIALRLHEVQDQLSSKTIKKLDTDLRKSKRRYWIKGFGWGAGGAIVLMTLQQIMTR